MSILIKGMKMPKAGKRPLWVVVHPDGVVEYDSGDYGWQTTKACEVSTPHGRLIDADRAIAMSISGGEMDHISSAPAIIEAEKGVDDKRRGN